MSAKLYSRPGVFTWMPRGFGHKGLMVADYAQFFDPTASTIEQKIDFIFSTDINAKPNLEPSVSVSTKYRFNEICWSHWNNDDFQTGICAGGTEDGTVVFFDPDALLYNNTFVELSARRDHHGHVLSVDVSHDGRWVVSGGGSGQLLLWDITNLTTPFSPGAPNYADQVKLVRWSKKSDSVFASISSNRISIWDMRRHGAPILEFGEIGNGCDWSSVVWCPSDATSLLVGSQSQNVPVVQRWDLRYASAPIKDFRNLHQRGVSYIDWNAFDDRLALSSGIDGQLLIWNPSSGEIIGGVGSLQGDWVRAARWSTAQPEQLAVQYVQQPVQIASLNLFSTPQPGAEVLKPVVSDAYIPAWRSAPTVGSSVAFGGRVATHWKSYDLAAQRYVYNVEVESLPKDLVMNEELEEFLNKRELKKLSQFFEHRGMDRDDDVGKLWKVLAVEVGDCMRSKLRDALFNGNPITEQSEPKSYRTDIASVSEYDILSASAAESRQSAAGGTESATSTASSTSDNFNFISSVNWDRLTPEDWDLLEKSVSEDYAYVIESLCQRGLYIPALHYANKKRRTHIFFNYYLRAMGDNLDNVSKLYLSFGTGVEETEAVEDGFLNGFSLDKWQTLVGFSLNEQKLSTFLRFNEKLGNKLFDEGYTIGASLCFILIQDVESLIKANKDFSLGERVFQALGLFYAFHAEDALIGPEFAKLLFEYCSVLSRNGLTENAFKLVADVNTDYEPLVELIFTLWNAAGGRACTGVNAPKCPYKETINFTPAQPVFNNQQVIQPTYPSVIQQQPTYGVPQYQPPSVATEYNNVHEPLRRNSLAPMPPSSMFYQTPSWDHKPPPKPLPEVPTQPVASGWNDPPPLTPKQKTATPQANVMHVNWKPLDTPAAPGGMLPYGAPAPINTVYGAPNGVHQPIATYGTVRPPSSIASQPSPAAPAPVVLTPEDQMIVDKLNQIVDAILATEKRPATINKANEIRYRLNTDLSVRLASNRLSAITRQYLHQIVTYSSIGDFRSAQHMVGEMARSGGDFVEVSSFMPSLKSLFSVAQTSLSQR